MEQGVDQVDGIGGRTGLIGDHVDGPVGRGQLLHRRHEIAGPGAAGEYPGRPYHVRLGQCGVNGPFTVELAATVDVERSGGVGDLIGPAQVTAEDVVAGYMHQPGAGAGAGAGQIPWTYRVDRVSPFGRRLGGVDIGELRTVDDRVCAVDATVDRCCVGDVEVRVGERRHRAATAGRLGGQQPADLAAGADDDDPLRHGKSLARRFRLPRMRPAAQ